MDQKINRADKKKGENDGTKPNWLVENNEVK